MIQLDEHIFEMGWFNHQLAWRWHLNVGSFPKDIFFSGANFGTSDGLMPTIEPRFMDLDSELRCWAGAGFKLGEDRGIPEYLRFFGGGGGVVVVVVVVWFDSQHIYI